VSIRWQTEACTVLSIPRPRRSCDVRRTDPAAVARLRALAADTPDRQIAEILDREGLSGSRRSLLTSRPLRTVHAPFNAYGSSIGQRTVQ